MSGDRAVIRYTMKDGHLKFDQRIQLQDDSRSVSQSRHAQRSFGIMVAHVDGTIRKLD